MDEELPEIPPLELRESISKSKKGDASRDRFLQACLVVGYYRLKLPANYRMSEFEFFLEREKVWKTWAGLNNEAKKATKTSPEEDIQQPSSGGDNSRVD